MSFWDRLTGRVVEAAGLGQKKRAAATGILAFDGPLSDLRLEIAIKGHPWLQNTATTTLLLSTWAAQALQELFVFVGRALFKGFEKQGGLGVYETVGRENPFFMLLAQHHVAEWLAEHEQGLAPQTGEWTPVLMGGGT